HLLSGPQVPHPYRLIPTGTRQAPPGGTERHRAYGASVLFAREDLLPRPRVPHLHLAREWLALRIKAPDGAGQVTAVGAERHAADGAGVPCGGEDFLARSRVPNSHLTREWSALPVKAPARATGQSLAVGAERHAGHEVRVPADGEEFQARN